MKGWRIPPAFVLQFWTNACYVNYIDEQDYQQKVLLVRESYLESVKLFLEDKGIMRIIDPNPDPSFEKVILCHNCGIKLGYLPKDIFTERVLENHHLVSFKVIACPMCYTAITVD